MIPDCCMQENKPNKPRKINIWPSKACLEATTIQDFDLDQVQRTEGLVSAVCQIFFRPCSAHALGSGLCLPLKRSGINCGICSAEAKIVRSLHCKVMYSKRQTQYQRLSLVMQMTAGENLLTVILLYPQPHPRQ